MIEHTESSRSKETLPPLTDLTDKDARNSRKLEDTVAQGVAVNRERLDDSGADFAAASLRGDVAEQGAKQNKIKKEKHEAHSGFVVPALEDLVEESTVVQTLSKEDQREAYETSKGLDFTNVLQTMNYGLDDQKKASEVTRQFIDEVRGADLDQLTKLAADQNDHMEKLNIGELRPSLGTRILRAILPSKKAQAVGIFLNKHKAISELIDVGEQAMSEERLKLQTHHARMIEKVVENREIYDALTKKIASAELSYASNKIRVDDLKSDYQEQQDPAKARDISTLDQALTRQSRRVNSLQASRQETLNAIRTMDIQLQGIESQIAMIDEQAAFNRLVWDNSVLMAATDRRMKNSVEAVRYNRENVEKMMKSRSGSIADTLGKIIAEQGAGVVNSAVLEFAAHELLRMNRAIIDGNKKIREDMAESNEVIGRIDQLVKDAAAQAAAMTDDDVARLDKTLREGGVALDKDKEESKLAAKE